MATKVGQIVHMTPEEKRFLRDVAIELAALRTSVTAITAKIDVLTAKLNADGGVTDTDYATNFAATCDPATSVFTE